MSGFFKSRLPGGNRNINVYEYPCDLGGMLRIGVLTTQYQAAPRFRTAKTVARTSMN
jgi:hypothetical protein